MKAKPSEPGRVVISTQGRDAGTWYAVLSVLDERYVLVSNGKSRGLAKPKKKQCKHLQALPLTVPVTGRGESGGPIADSDLRKALQTVHDAYITKIAGSRQCAGDEKEECAFVQE